MVLSIIFIFSCSSGDDDDDNNDDNNDDMVDPMPVENVQVDRVGRVVLDDVYNNDDASDLEVLFTRPGNESNISEYRILITKAETTFNITQEIASDITPDRYLAVTPANGDILSQMPDDILDTDGDFIIDGIDYRAVVLSVADGTTATINQISFPSNEMALAETTVKITYMANDGVMIEDENHKVLIDAMPSTLTGWIPVSPGEQVKMEQGKVPYHDINVAMITHNHGDHFNPQSSLNFLTNNKEATIIAPPQVRSSINRPGVSDISPAFQQSITQEVNGVKITVYHLRHFNLFGNDFSAVQNYVYLVELGGKKIIHFGDVDYERANLASTELASLGGVDVAIIPTFHTLISAENKLLIEEEIAPQLIMGIHLQSSTSVAEVLSVYPEAVVMNKSLEFIRL